MSRSTRAISILRLDIKPHLEPLSLSCEQVEVNSESLWFVQQILAKLVDSWTLVFWTFCWWQMWGSFSTWRFSDSWPSICFERGSLSLAQGFIHHISCLLMARWLPGLLLLNPCEGPGSLNRLGAYIRITAHPEHEMFSLMTKIELRSFFSLHRAQTLLIRVNIALFLFFLFSHSHLWILGLSFLHKTLSMLVLMQNSGVSDNVTHHKSTILWATMWRWEQNVTTASNESKVSKSLTPLEQS